MAYSCMLGIFLFSTGISVTVAELFKTFPGALKFSDAVTFCNSQGMVLPVLKSPLEQSLAVAALGPSPEWEYWIGLDYLAGDFRWGDNSPMCWENWFVSAANEPNNLGTEQCVVMRGRGSSPGAWLTKGCSNNNAVICHQYTPAQDGLFNEYNGVIPIGTPLMSLFVWTETACVLLCDFTSDCAMATHDPKSAMCSTYDCHNHVTNTPGRVTWIKQ